MNRSPRSIYSSCCRRQSEHLEASVVHHFLPLTPASRGFVVSRTRPDWRKIGSNTHSKLCAGQLIHRAVRPGAEAGFRWLVIALEQQQPYLHKHCSWGGTGGHWGAERPTLLASRRPYEAGSGLTAGTRTGAPDLPVAHSRFPCFVGSRYNFTNLSAPSRTRTPGRPRLLVIFFF